MSKTVQLFNGNGGALALHNLSASEHIRPVSPLENIKAKLRMNQTILLRSSILLQPLRIFGQNIIFPCCLRASFFCTSLAFGGICGAATSVFACRQKNRGPSV